MSAFVGPLRLILLAGTPQWRELLSEHLNALAYPAALICASSWPMARELLAESPDSVLLTTRERLPEPGQCAAPIILLLEDEPAEPPAEAGDWLVRERLTEDVLRRCLRYVREQGNLRDTLQRLTELDALTGIANRQGFQTLLAARLGERGSRGLALVHLDLDNFQQANDTLGHRAGDHLIQQVVARLKAHLGHADQLARLGGDEFALLLDTRGEPGRAEAWARRMADAFCEPYWVDGESLLLGCSLGVAQAQATNSADTLMWHAHIAMQQAKGRQGCTYHLYDERLDRGMRSQADLQRELRRALRREELQLHYQPRLCLHTGGVVGLEALVRWQHGQHGLLAPSEFVPLAEESGLIVPLGYWVISRALRDMQWLGERGQPALHMAVNLSFRQFQDSQLLPTLERLIDERGIDARWLEFELTETAVMRRSEQVQQTMRRLGQLGVRFSLDDFGTGFSSFEHLSNLPIALLKIDRSFVDGMQRCPQRQQLVQAMINLAHNLDLQVVAEGVETAEQLQLLRRFGCDQVQGYLISRALPLDDLAGFLAAGRLRLPESLDGR
ncbi:putative bifunctional diguanylate cyclase/phosphodiesterase [Phytopseudomonas dryadis]|uniref:GGDEF-domain containing protein n=1 Tax=Phytopseudomonas dryadis TaxID=2487520 RepID=A0ABY1ZAT3_9GAMM|nr:MULTISPECIES: bifunctional diguanylate cyclase/phosphodiesterase [Pseudomonas]TBV08689.1 GGDEF-domain containing protein [Pseudomonas dryadis]TBV13876.1 GGDEF-domain containing protein [Pseudomonas sp. FRB 230]